MIDFITRPVRATNKWDQKIFLGDLRGTINTFGLVFGSRATQEPRGIPPFRFHHNYSLRSGSRCCSGMGEPGLSLFCTLWKPNSVREGRESTVITRDHISIMIHRGRWQAMGI